MKHRPILLLASVILCCTLLTSCFTTMLGSSGTAVGARASDGE